MDFSEPFRKCSHTELYQIARRAGHNVHPLYSREQLIKVITLEEEGSSTPNEFDEIRLAIMRHLIEHRKRLETQITCPAKSFLPDACFGCVDAQVAHCYVNNGEDNQRLIQLHKKPST